MLNQGTQWRQHRCVGVGRGVFGGRPACYIKRYRGADQMNYTFRNQKPFLGYMLEILISSQTTPFGASPFDFCKNLPQ